MIATFVLAAALATASPAAVPAAALMPSSPAVSQVQGTPNVGVPAPKLMTSCNADLTCAAPFTPGTVSCTGSVSCFVESPNGVACDGTFVTCTCPGLPDYCAQAGDGFLYCQCRADGHNNAYCVRTACTN